MAHVTRRGLYLSASNGLPAGLSRGKSTQQGANDRKETNPAPSVCSARHPRPARPPRSASVQTWPRGLGPPRTPPSETARSLAAVCSSPAFFSATFGDVAEPRQHRERQNLVADKSEERPCGKHSRRPVVVVSKPAARDRRFVMNKVAEIDDTLFVTNLSAFAEKHSKTKT